MAVGQPFTDLCRQMADLQRASLADLHVHSTHSDGRFTPAELVRQARAAGLIALAITDHDALDAFADAQTALREPPPPLPLGRVRAVLELVPGVEITTDFDGREAHLLAYWFDPTDAGLRGALDRLRDSRRDRLREMAERLRALGLSVEESFVDAACSAPGQAPGRRLLAEHLVATGQAATTGEVFARYLRTSGPASVPASRIPIADAVSLVRGAGGVTSLAHPSDETPPGDFAELRDLGVDALEAEYPWPGKAHRAAIREAARRWGFAVTGGSDCHGPQPPARQVGRSGVQRPELERLRQRRPAPATA